MSRLIYNRAFATIGGSWTSDVIRVLLERSTSAYTPNRDHHYLSEWTSGGGVEISVASYARQTIGSKAVNVDTTKDQIEFDGADLAFGNLESGQTVKALIGYRQVGGDDATPANDELLWYDDGKIDVVAAADASLGATQVWVEPLEADIPNGTAVDFGGGATATLTSAASRGDRSIACSALAAAVTAGDVSATATDSILPAVLQNGPFNLQVHADGYLLIAQRGKFSI